MSDGDHFGAEGDWSTAKTKALGKSLADLVGIVVKEKDKEIASLRTALATAKKHAKEAVDEALAAFNERDQLIKDRTEWRTDRDEWKARAGTLETALKREQGLVAAAMNEAMIYRKQRDEARANARILAHAYTHDTRLHDDVIAVSLAYPVDARAEKK